MLRCTCLISIDTVFYGFYASTMLSWHDAVRVSAVQWICQDGIHKGVVKYGVNKTLVFFFTTPQFARHCRTMTW